MVELASVANVCTITNTRVTVVFDKANELGDNATVEPCETIPLRSDRDVNTAWRPAWSSARAA